MRPPVWFRSIFLKTLRDYRVAILGWGVGMGLVILSPMASVSTLINTPQARAALSTLAAQFTWNADPVAADTVGGYATFKIGIFIFLIALWPLLAASRTLRGEEDRGSIDVLLSAPRSRLTIALQKVAAIWTALLFIGLITGVMAYLGGRAFKVDPQRGRPVACWSCSSSSTWSIGSFRTPSGCRACRRSTTTT